MSWQEEEIKMRREQQAAEEEQQKRKNIRVREIQKFWRNILEANEGLPREIKMPVEERKNSIGQYIETCVKGKKDCELNYGNGIYIQYRVLSTYKGSSIMHERYRIGYDIDKAVICIDFTSNDNGHQFLPITNESIPNLIRNLCTGRNITEDLIQQCPVGLLHITLRKEKTSLKQRIAQFFTY